MIEYRCPICGRGLKRRCDVLSYQMLKYCEKCNEYYTEEFFYKYFNKITDKGSIHKAICVELNDLYKGKNEDYGDSFHQSFKEEGLTMLRIRLGDKWNRFKTLSKSGDQKVKDESIRDTLLDLANYAIMGIMELDLKD